MVEAATLSADVSKAGKQRYSAWRMQHARWHFNVQPGEYGKASLRAHMKYFLLDSLHVALLNIPKVLFKYGFLNLAAGRVVACRIGSA